MQQKFDHVCKGCKKTFSYYADVLGFKVISGVTVAVIRDRSPFAICPFCDNIKKYNYTSNISSDCVYIEVPKALREDEYAFKN